MDEDLNAGDQFVCDWSDGMRESMKLDMANMITTTVMVHNQDIGAWCCLKPRSLSDDVVNLAREGFLHNPEHGRVKGRKPSTRLKPGHGPGSGSKGMKKKQSKKKKK